MKRYVWLGVGLLLCIGVVFSIHYALRAPLRTEPQQSMQASVSIGSTTVPVILAATSQDRQLGLSGRASLPKNQGMLFVFDAPGRWGFWMKDMRFPIDIIWLDADSRVVTVAQNVSPQSYPKVFYPTKPAQYVLELSAGESAVLKIVEGQQLSIKGFK